MPPVPTPPVNALEFNLDQVLHIVGPMFLALVSLLTAAGRAIWKKLNYMQAELDNLKRKVTHMGALHEVNHPGQEID